MTGDPTAGRVQDPTGEAKPLAVAATANSTGSHAARFEQS